MLFITNRAPVGSIRTRARRRFKFDLGRNDAGNSVFYCRQNQDGTYEEVGSKSFYPALTATPHRQLLLYIHGFSQLPETVLSAAKELQTLCDGKKCDEALVVPLIWPCDKDFGIVKDYWDDQKAADGSAFAFARALQGFLEWREQDSNTPCHKRINVLAHSMGSRVLRETLIAWKRYDLPGGVPLLFRNTFLLAADIVNESLHKRQPGELIAHASRNVLVYFASDDLAMRGSKVANLKNRIASRRLGHTGPEDMRLAPDNVFAIDCDDVNTIYDSPMGHTYFRYGSNGKPGLVFEHIFDTITHGRPKDMDRSKRELTIT